MNVLEYKNCPVDVFGRRRERQFCGINKKRASSEKTLRDSLKSPELLINNSD